MAKTNWQAVAEQYERDRIKTGISAKEWCEQRGINYASARRYLKSRGQSPDESATFQAAAQSAQKKVRKSAQKGASAQSGGNAQKRKTGKALRKSGEEPQTGVSEIVKPKGRDEAGRFLAGEYEGNPNPPRNRVVPGNQLPVTHGGYARYFSDQSAFDGVDELGLQDELRLCRARVISVTKALNDLAVLLDSATAPDEKATIYGQILRADEALQRNISRVESIERTLSGLRIDALTAPKIEADTDRIRAAARKLTAEANKLERDEGGDATPISEMVAELQDMGTGGLMSGG
ncbi:terminase [Pseudaeromonas paramecii]|uniref:Terminase n=1 Tax=Pseudaeromonas paramecii TaxID=2138166 RepID=A0ABP8PYJ6_9GAMM